MSPDAAPPPLSVRALVALCVLNHVALTGARLALVEQAIRLGVPAAGVGLMFAPFALASTLGALPLGRWVDRIGARRPALAGMALTALALAVSALWPVPGVLAAAAGVVGLGYTASLIALQAEIARGRDEPAHRAGIAASADEAAHRAGIAASADEPARRAGFAAFALGTAASSGFGPFLAGQVMAHGGARDAFGVLAAVAMASLVGAATRAARLQRKAGAASVAPSHPSFKGLGGLRRLMLADLGMALAWNANGFVVPLVAHRHGWPADVAGNLLGCFGAAVLLVRALPHAWRARGRDWGAVTRALLASGAVLVLLPLVGSMPAQFALQLLMGCAMGSSLPSMMALVDARTPGGRRAEVIGLRQAVLGFGATATPATVGALVAVGGLVPALAVVGGALLVLGAAVSPREDASVQEAS